MGLQFNETMSGWVELQDGRHDFEFTVDVHSPRWILAGVKAELVGTVRLAGLLSEAGAIEGGSLEVGWPRNRLLGYDFSFSDDLGRGLRFVGTKSFELLHPLRSMTSLRGVLWQGQEKLGPAELSFALSELWPFLRSFRSWSLPSLQAHEAA